MKVILMITDCTAQYLVEVLSCIKKVLKELEVETQIVDLCSLPYYKGKKARQMDKIIEMLSSADAVIGVTPVHMLGVHAAMQSFFDYATQYDSSLFDKPILAVTYSQWMGETEVADRMLRAWNVLGGKDGNKICMNSSINLEEMLQRVERDIEDFYRLIKQNRKNIPSTERLVYLSCKDEKQMQPNSIRKEEHQDIIQKSTQESAQEARKMTPLTDILKQRSSIDLAVDDDQQIRDVKERNIQEISKLLKEQIKATGDEFTSFDHVTYKKPTGPSQVSSLVSKKLQHLPHYFIAQHEKDLNMKIQYIVTDINEIGYIVIEGGDCSYYEGTIESPNVELTLNEEVLMELLSKKLTYQKAFMLGRLKVRGNFVVLSKLDQIFKAM